MKNSLDVHSVRSVRAAEDRAFAVTRPGELMARASFALASAVRSLLARTYLRVYGTRVVLVVGPGNNGADALFAGVSLLGSGVQVHAFAVVPGAVAPEALAAFRRAGGTMMNQPAGEFDLCVDGISGLGSRRPLDPELARWMNSHPLVVSVDIPSGVDPDTGCAERHTCVHADVTVTFGAVKPGLVLAPGAEFAGEVELVDIGLEFIEDPFAVILGAHRVAELLPQAEFDSYKYSRGVVGIAAGSTAFPGAAHLTAASALGSGVGMVVFHGSCAPQVINAFPEIVSATDLSSHPDRIRSWGIGPGFMGTVSAENELLFLDFALKSDVPVVLDAGALTHLAREKALQDLVRSRSAPTVLTPHAGEFDRLFPSSGTMDVDSLQWAASNFNAIIVAKGPRSLMCDPQGRMRIDVQGSPALATAGSGDVLTGVVAGLLASCQNADVLDVVAAAVWLHGRAGEIARQRHSNPTATDIGRALRTAIDDTVAD